MSFHPPIGFSKSSSKLAEEVGISKSRVIVLAIGSKRGKRVLRRPKMTEGRHYKTERDGEGIRRYWFNDRIKILRGRVWLTGECTYEDSQVNLFNQIPEEDSCKPT